MPLSRIRQKGEDLLGLQTDFARKYSVLREHVEECELCQLVSKIGGRDYLGALVSYSHARVLL